MGAGIPDCFPTVAAQALGGGYPALFFYYEPDWSEAVEVVRVHRTVRSVALSTAEDRRAMGARALVNMSYTILTRSAVETEHLKRAVAALAQYPVAVPLWPEMMRTRPGLYGDPSTMIRVETTVDYRVAAGDLAAGWVNFTEFDFTKFNGYKAFLVDEVGADYLTSTTPGIGAIGGGAMVAPVKVGRLATRPEITHVTDEVARVNIEFEEQYV
jgi:hypothetical protein